MINRMKRIIALLPDEEIRELSKPFNDLDLEKLPTLKHLIGFPIKDGEQE